MFSEEEIAVAEDSGEIVSVMEPVSVVGTSGEMETEVSAERDVRAMKDHIDLEASQSQQPRKLPSKDLKEIVGSFWLATSTFSKKWQKWRGKQKLKAGGKENRGSDPPLPRGVQGRRVRRRRPRVLGAMAGPARPRQIQEDFCQRAMSQDGTQQPFSSDWRLSNCTATSIDPALPKPAAGGFEQDQTMDNDDAQIGVAKTQGKYWGIFICWLLGNGCLFGFNEMLTIEDYYVYLFP
ncbi:hypothetical protein ACJX0J_020322, partial [Zea mays]